MKPLQIVTVRIVAAIFIFALTLNFVLADAYFDALKKHPLEGDVDAQFKRGIMYVTGEGVPQDDAEAVKWFKKAAEQRHVWAQLNLGDMYAHGKGVPEDDAEAVRWLKKSAEQGNAFAQYSLGVEYVKGEGAPEDYVQAYKW
jgi:TPR repeat protein